ncbi:MAG: glycosyltransferase [Bacteroidales bacterium]|nr:glycosyltransferase [Bacteroidales bacterium]
MKVAIISRGKPTPKYPLYGIFEFDQAKALAKKGIEVAFIAIDFRAWAFKRKYGLFKYECERVHVYELSLPINAYRRGIPFLQRLLLVSFKAMVKEFGKPDIIHAHFYSIAAIASILKKKYSIPFVITEHSSKLNKPATEISNLDKRLATKAYQNCDRLITVSEALRDNIFRNFGYDSIVIPNMVDNQCFQYLDKAKDDAPFVFVSVGNLIPIKAFDKLIEAFSQVKDDIKLLIIGEGPERERLQNQIKNLRLEAQVKLLGQLKRDEINKVYQESHVFVLASQSETFGVSYIEAMYAGLPVIATRCGGPESFVNDSNGMLVPLNDVDALAHAMLTMHQNYHEYSPKEISDNCIAKFSPEVIAERIIKSYSF